MHHHGGGCIRDDAAGLQYRELQIGIFAPRRRVTLIEPAGFFEHRLRSDAEFNEKASYIRMNPVRTGLVALPGLWPYVEDTTTTGGGVT